MSEAYVGLVGNPGDGFTVWGPFESFDDMQNELDGNEWWGMTLNTHVRFKWQNPLVQFARLIAEMEAVGFFAAKTEHHKALLEELRTSTDMSEDNIYEIVDRAQSFWDEHLRIERQLDNG